MANDININESAILETLNAKIDYDGGNYKGSGLANYVVDKTGDTITGYLTGTANLFPFIAQSDVMDITTTPTANQFIGYDYRDKNGTRIGWCGVVNNANGTKYFQIQNQGVVDGFAFPRCTTKATTTSSAANHKVAVITQNYVNGTSWYRVWSDGWCEQGGVAASGSGTSVTLLKAYSNTNYTIQLTLNKNAADSSYSAQAWPTAKNSFTIYGSSSGVNESKKYWTAFGYTN